MEQPSNKKTEKFQAWKNLVEDEIIPFFDWDEENAVIQIEKPLKDIEIKEIQSQYGLGHYIEIEWNENKYLLKIDSKRLRIALHSLRIVEYPAKISLTREGIKFNTTYTANLL